MSIVIENTITAFNSSETIEYIKVPFYIIDETVPVPQEIYVQIDKELQEEKVVFYEEHMPIIDPGELTQYYIKIKATKAFSIALRINENDDWSNTVSYKPTTLTDINIESTNWLLPDLKVSAQAKEDYNGEDSLNYCIFTLVNARHEIIEQSSKIYKSQNNKFTYIFSKYYNNPDSYRIIILFATKFGYIAQKYTEFIELESFIIPVANISGFDIKANYERGYNEIIVPANYYLLRGDEKNNWHLLMSPSEETKQYNDFIIDYGIKYNYRILELDSKKGQNKEVYNLYEDIFLTDQSHRFLKIKYNPDITNYKRNIVDTITPTLGGAYPFIRRNGQQKYRTFNIGGLISYNADIYEDMEFTIPNSIGTINALYPILDETFVSNIDYLKRKDKEFLLERQYRDAILEYLYDSRPKLFKSPTEGLILVTLSNISLTPNKQLGRMIYSFTAQATEIAEATYENLEKYSILPPAAIEYIYNDYVLYGTYDADTLIVNDGEGAIVEDDEGILIIHEVQTEVKEG